MLSFTGVFLGLQPSFQEGKPDDEIGEDWQMKWPGRGGSSITEYYEFTCNLQRTSYTLDRGGL
jgi:hypothetical protein